MIVHLGRYGFLVAAVDVVSHNNHLDDNVVGLHYTYPVVLAVFGLRHDGYPATSAVSIHRHLVTPVVHYYPAMPAVSVHRNLVVPHSYPARPVQPVSTSVMACDA